MANYNGAGSLFALGMRLAKLGGNGAPLVGAQNAYVTDALVAIELGLEYEDGDEIIQKNGAGEICLSYKAPDSLKYGNIEGFQVCTPDPVVLSFLTGGSVIYAADGTPTGFQAPPVGANPNPNGVSIEFWTRAVLNGAFVGYFWWAVPNATVRPDDTWVANGEDPMLPSLVGTCVQNPNWGDGPGNDWVWPSDRVWQFNQVTELPVTLAPPRFVPVETELTVTTLEVTPATETIADNATAQLTATATMSDASTRDVTQQATWSSASPTVVTVDEDGIITGQSAGGPVNVTATYLSQTDTCAVTVTA